MNAILINKSLQRRAYTLLCQDFYSVTSPFRVTEFLDDVIFSFDSPHDLSKASALLYSACILHRFCILSS